jgi:CrcB protein
MPIPTLPLVLAFGAVGTGLRYGLDQWLGKGLPTIFPWVTFGINIAGCFALGLIAGAEPLRTPELAPLRSALMVGLCGGFTTFSTFGLQNLELLQRSAWVPFLAYALGSVALGIAAVAGGFAIARA